MSSFGAKKFKTFKYDSAPFFFYIDIFPNDPELENDRSKSVADLIKLNPINPLPMRVDRVFNGEQSVLIRPKEPIVFPISESTNAIINTVPFLQLGIEKLLFFTEIRANEQFFETLVSKPGRFKVSKWWDTARNTYAPLDLLEEDFSAFLRSYLFTVVKAKIENGDLLEAARTYCDMVHDACEKRMNENSIRTDMKGKIKDVKLYKKKDISFYKKMKKVKETQYHPELIDIEIFDLEERGFTEGEDRSVLFEELKKSEKIKYIALLFYDDLMECMLQNLERLNNGDTDILDPSYLIDNNIIIIEDRAKPSSIDMKTLSWWSNFKDIDLNAPIEKINSGNKTFFNLQSELDSITGLMDKQQFAEALEKFKEFTEKVKDERHFHFASSIENYMKACEINLELIDENNKYIDLYENGKLQESYDGLSKLLEKIKDEELKDYIDGNIEVKIERAFRMVVKGLNPSR